MPQGGWKDFFIEIFAWWRGNTWGTRLWAATKGVYVGSDQFGNRYYRSKTPNGPHGMERRMVIYGGGYAEPTTIPPGWYGWMHYRAAQGWRLHPARVGEGTRPELYRLRARLPARRQPAQQGRAAARDRGLRRLVAGQLTALLRTLAVLLLTALTSPVLAETISNPIASFSGLDKITGRITNFDVYIGETVQFGSLQITPRVCYTRPPTETQRTSVFVEVDQVSLNGGAPDRIFTGWMFADSPALNAIDHPIYDIWLVDCKQTSDTPPPPDFNASSAEQGASSQAQDSTAN